MLACIIFFSSLIVATGTRNAQPLLSSTKGSCEKLCTCKEKDGVLHLNCEERNITKITQIQLPSAVPFHLNLYKNDLVELRAVELVGFRNAISLHLGSNSIQELEPGVFSALSSLKRLHINGNFFVTLKEDTFHGLVNLEYLQADANFIHLVEPGTFSKLINLKVLILNDNAIDFLPNNIFRFVPLTHLDLRGNQLQSLPYMGFLEHLGRIMELLLEDNDWVCNCEILPLKIWMENMSGQSSISEVVCSSPPHLKDSHLSKVEREGLCPSYSDLEGHSMSLLETMSSKAGQVPKVMDAKDDAKIPAPDHKLGVAICSERCSCHIHPTAGFLIHCQDRGIRQISDLGLLHQTPTKLVMTGNMIQRLFQYDFVPFEGLELLNLANNQIDYIDDETFLSLGQLKKLHLNGNRLENISLSMFVGLHSVEYLYLEYNVIKDILPGTFDTMPNLKLLCLNNNLLHTLPSQVFHNLPLARLNLRKNVFKHLSVNGVLDQLHSLEQIHLEDNPWDCNCDLVSLKQWVEKLRKDTVVGTVLCQTPRNIAKVELRALRLDVMCSGLVMLHSLTTKKGVEGTPTTAITERSSDGFFHLFANTVPLSVVILSLLIIFLVIIFCAAGMAVLFFHRRRTSDKKETNNQLRENRPIHLQYSMYGQKSTHHAAQRPNAGRCSEPAQNLVMQTCRSPTYCAHNKEHELDELSLDEMKHVCRSLLEQENNLPPAGPNLKLRAVTEHPSDFVTLGDRGSLYQNILNRERALQQRSITDYLRKNIAQLQPPVEIQGQGTLMETIMYARSRKVLVEQSKNEYFELEANLHTEPNYMEVIEHQASVT